MKSISRAVLKFCYKHPRFGIPKLMLIVVAGTAAVYLFTMMDTTGTLQYYISLDPAAVLRGEVWRLVTWVFMPYNSNLLQMALALYFSYFIGSALESLWGTGRFTFYYLSGVVLHVVFVFLVHFFFHFYLRRYETLDSAGDISLDPFFSQYMYFYISSLISNAAYLHLSMFFAYASHFPENTILLFFLIPIKVKWLALLNAVLFAYSIGRSIFIGAWILTLTPIVAILNFLLLVGVELPKKTIKRDFKTVRFRNAVNPSNHERVNIKHLHKCTICGRTDKTDPELEFRYCSRCDGYKCYCADHINSHEHV